MTRCSHRTRIRGQTEGMTSRSHVVHENCARPSRTAPDRARGGRGLRSGESQFAMTPTTETSAPEAASHVMTCISHSSKARCVGRQCVALRGRVACSRPPI